MKKSLLIFSFLFILFTLTSCTHKMKDFRAHMFSTSEVSQVPISLSAYKLVSVSISGVHSPVLSVSGEPSIPKTFWLTKSKASFSAYDRLRMIGQNSDGTYFLGLSLPIKMAQDGNSFFYTDLLTGDKVVMSAPGIGQLHINKTIQVQATVQVSDPKGKLIDQKAAKFTFMQSQKNIPNPQPLSADQQKKIEKQNAIFKTFHNHRGDTFYLRDNDKYPVYVQTGPHGKKMPYIIDINGLTLVLAINFEKIDHHWFMISVDNAGTSFQSWAVYNRPDSASKSSCISTQFDGYNFSSDIPKMSLVVDIHSATDPKGHHVYQLPIESINHSTFCTVTREAYNKFIYDINYNYYDEKDRDTAKFYSIGDSSTPKTMVLQYG